MKGYDTKLPTKVSMEVNNVTIVSKLVHNL